MAISLRHHRGDMDLEYGWTIIFQWAGMDEGDEVSGTRSAALMDDGSLDIDLSFFHGGGTVLKAHRD